MAPKETLSSPWAFCVAPMMDWTDRHCRYFHRVLAPGARLYTEMVTTGAVLHGDRDRLLAFDPSEHPVALQLGGSEPDALAASARIAEDLGYDEVNLNVGCPSDRVQSGRFGACLMREPDLVAECVAAMGEAVSIPVTVKHRIGVDDQDDQVDLDRFVATVAAAGCRVFIVHARKAWLQGVSPKENRELPPLNYDRVYGLKSDYPDLTIVINGGIDSLGAAQHHLERVAGVMLGRAAYQNPYLLAQLDAMLAGSELLERERYLNRLIPYIERELGNGVYLKHISRHLLGLYQGIPGAKRWRRIISERAHLAGADVSVIEEARDAVLETAVV
ncbi:MAG: tRNA dihydrouridine(20/20a) synthase DusA [Xanthomonadales bacterium]|nr:tRNA dihydrouridine(20/20a) synthase DusA [Xanthomonadales bacterium]